jgi:hypothetical protein
VYAGRGKERMRERGRDGLKGKKGRREGEKA